MQTKRARDAENETAHELQRHKSALDEAASEFLCPITQSLPVDPVTAEDGKVYERSAIEEWLESQQRSPLTNEAMGTRLMPALQVKNMIRGMMQSGALTGEKVDAWKEKLAEEKEVADTRRKAEAGDGEAMCSLGHWYYVGDKGLAEDYAKAFEWFHKSHEAGDPTGTARLGGCYFNGLGVERSELNGVALLAEGALSGSKGACFALAFRYAEGACGFAKDLKLARRWYSQVATASVNDSTVAELEMAAAWLRDHPDRYP